tara:strand:+ start:8766 stop:9653 length:888 start_codon:yes stop_codon:yes gene_type:complete
MVDDTNEDVIETTEETTDKEVSLTPEQEQVEEILDPRPYHNKYRNDLDDEDTVAATETQDTQKATPEERPVTAEEKAFKKRYDDLKRHYDKTLSKHKNEVTSLRTQVEQSANKLLPPKDPAELAEWKTQYPDVYEVIETISLKQADARTKQLEDKFQNLQTQQIEIAKEKAEIKLLKKHPDFQEIRATDQFHEWAQVQDPTIQGWLYDNTDNADLAARAIDLYKMDSGIVSNNKSKSSDIKKEAAKAVTSTKKGNQVITEKKIWSVDEISRLKPSQFEKHEKEIMLARREGRIKA